MKKFILTIFVLFTCITYSIAAGYNLIITFNDGTSAVYSLTSQPKITMANDKLVLSSTSISAEYTLNKVKNFKYKDATGINSVNQDYTIHREGDKIILSGVVKVDIYTIDGSAVQIDPIQTSSSTIIDLSALRQGVYIIRANGKSVKITKK